MAAAKHSFEVKASLSNPIVEVALSDGTLLRMEGDDKYETTDPRIAAELDAVDALKRAEKGSK